MDYDVIVIGGGTSGLRSAIISAKSGFKTALIEPGKIGGTCLNDGCIPTKTILHAAETYNSLKDLWELGIKAEKISYDFSKVMGRMKKIVTSGRSHAEKSVDNIENLTLYKRKAEFVSDNRVKAGNAELTGKNIIIATGSSPWTPPIKGLDEAGHLDNVSTLELKEQPKSLLMIGGGYISCEFACFFASFGTKVTILEKFPNILGMLDQEFSDFMKEKLELLGIEIINNVDILEIKGKNGEGVEIPAMHKGKHQAYKADYLFVSTGRRPNTGSLHLDNAGVKTEKGSIVVNDHLQTSKKNIYAIGDVNGKAPFAHSGKREARVALENALLGGDRKIRHDLVPWAVFTFPSIGGIGLSEKQAKDKGIDYGVMKADYGKVGKAKILRKDDGFVKVIFDKKSRKVLGCTIVGEQSHNMIHEFAVLMNTPSAKLDHLLETIHIHPTLSEVMGELKEV